MSKDKLNPDPWPALPRRLMFKPTGNENLDKALAFVPSAPMPGNFVRTSFDGEKVTQTAIPAEMVLKGIEDDIACIHELQEETKALDKDAQAAMHSALKRSAAIIHDAGEAKKRGRPAKPKPWLAEGVSKAAWYRRRKEERDGK